VGLAAPDGGVAGDVDPMATEYAGLLPRYKHLRRLGLGLKNRLTKTLTRDVLDEGGKKLGILKRGVLVLDTEDEIAVLMDYCLHDVRRRGVNAVERYLASPPVAPESDELILLQALRQARYSLFVVESAAPGVGVHVRDLLRDEPLFLVDVGLSRSATVGTILASRVMAPEGIGMTTGAGLPLGVLSPSRRAGFLEGLRAAVGGVDFRHLSPEDASKLTATIIRTCLRIGAAEWIEYVEPEQRRRPGSASPALAPAQSVRRNDPCPCGSGKKFKRCCGRRQ
jgi:SEC-C motif